MASCWSGRRGSNSLPPPWQGGALPDELRPHIRCIYPCTLPFVSQTGPPRKLANARFCGEEEKFQCLSQRSCFANLCGGPDNAKKRYQYAAVAHLVERHLAKVEVASSSLVGRSNMKPSLMQKCKDDGFFAFLFAQNCQKHPFAGGRNRQIAKIVHFLLPNGPE